MNYDLKVILAHLKALGYQNDDQFTLWQKVLNTIKEPIPDQLMEAANLVAQSINAMSEQAAQLSKLGEEDLKLAFEMAMHAKNTEAHLIQFETLTKSAQMQIGKSLWGGTKYFAKETLRLLPFIGFVFSFLLALKNFIYGLSSFSQLVSEAELLGLNWLDTLIPEKLLQEIDRHREDPEKLSILARITKYSRIFVDEGISFLANSADLIKDIIFAFIDVATFGWMTIADISLSVAFMGLEWVAEGAVLGEFDQALRKIVGIVNEKIESLINGSETDRQSLYQWFLD